MGHVKQKKSTSSSTSTPPESSGIELKESAPYSRRSYPEQLNVEELISQINCRIDVVNDKNNNRNRNSIVLQQIDIIDIENGPPSHRHHQKPLFRRLIAFIRNLWIGAKFSVGSDDCELEELEAPQRYRPESLSTLSKKTKFSESEIKRMYRGFKSHCPNGMVKEDTFKLIYAQFFPQGANTSLYAHYVFNTLDKEKDTLSGKVDHSGTLSFEKFVQGLSILSRGSIEEKLSWTFQLYDINSDGFISKEEMTDIVTAVYNLMGNPVEEKINEEMIKAKVDRIFDKMDKNHDGVVTIDEFKQTCHEDDGVMRSISVFDSTI